MIAGEYEHGSMVWCDGLPTVRIRGSLDGVKELHVADVVEVDLVFQNDDQPLSVQANGEDGGGESKFAYC